MAVSQRQYKQGQTIFREGEQGNAVYLIKSGQVEIFKEKDGEHLSLVTLGPNMLFGEMSLIDNAPRAASARFVDGGVCIIIDADTFRKKMEGVDPLVKTVLKMLLQNVRDNANKVVELSKGK